MGLFFKYIWVLILCSEVVWVFIWGWGWWIYKIVGVGWCDVCVGGGVYGVGWFCVGIEVGSGGKIVWL